MAPTPRGARHGMAPAWGRAAVVGETSCRRDTVRTGVGSPPPSWALPVGPGARAAGEKPGHSGAAADRAGGRRAEGGGGAAEPLIGGGTGAAQWPRRGSSVSYRNTCSRTCLLGCNGCRGPQQCARNDSAAAHRPNFGAYCYSLQHNKSNLGRSPWQAAVCTRLLAELVYSACFPGVDDECRLSAESTP